MSALEDVLANAIQKATGGIENAVVLREVVFITVTEYGLCVSDR